MLIHRANIKGPDSRGFSNQRRSGFVKHVKENFESQPPREFYTQADCKINKPAIQTNPRYKNFTQMYYTVGDDEQFWEAVTLSKKQPTKDIVFRGTQKINMFEQEQIKLVPNFDGYKMSPAQVEDTFHYIFDKFKKGIYIKIHNNQLESFVPFSKACYINEWSDLIKIDPKYGDQLSFFKIHHDLSNKLNGTRYSFNKNKIQSDPALWYANNCILRYENPINEDGNNYAQIKSMFSELCQLRAVPDAAFFVNKRDFPLLTRNRTEPYTQIYGDGVPLKSHNYDKYLPILGMCTSADFADIAIPTHEDWSRIKSKEGIYFPWKCKSYNFQFNHIWETKRNMAVFRGSNTGCGWNASNNMRLKLAEIGARNPELLNCGITNWNLRIRKTKSSPYLQIPDVGSLSLVSKLSPEEQSNFKYLINIDGHVSAFRLSLELSMGCCILLVESKWKMWFSDLLKPYVHYVPVKEDLSNLLDQIEWCLKHDEECKLMALEALKFYNKYLTKDGVLDYLQETLVQLVKEYSGQDQSKKENVDPLIFQNRVEHFALTNVRVGKYKTTGLFPKNVGRNYGVLKGFENFIVQSLKPEDQITLTGVEVASIFRSKKTHVILYQIGAEYVVAKKTHDPIKKIEFVHEAFIGKNVINNLLKLCPNFVFTFSYRDEPYLTEVDQVEKDSSVLQEFIKGPTLQKFITQSGLKNCIEIIFQLSCALINAQENCDFVHHDLKPWNIMVNVLPEPINIDYTLANVEGKVRKYRVKTKYIPIIIDYGKSHVIYNNVHYGIVDQFQVNSREDFVTMVIAMLNELTSVANENVDKQDLVFISNFVSQNKIVSYEDLLVWIKQNKKFGTFKQERFKDFKIEEFFKYMVPLIKKYRISFGMLSELKESEMVGPSQWISNSRQITDMGFGLEEEDRIATYAEVCRRIYKNPLPQATNKFTTIMIAQKLYEGLVIPKMEFLELYGNSDNFNINEKKLIAAVNKEFNKTEKFIVDFYSKLIATKKREKFMIPYYPEILNFKLAPSRSLLLDNTLNDQIKTELDKYPLNLPNYKHYAVLIADVLRNTGPFKIEKEDRDFYLDNFKILYSPTYISKVIALETIRFYKS